MKCDAELKQDVEYELKWEPSVNEAHIGVTAKSGVVTLSGHVPSLSEKTAAEKATKRVYGVKAVANEIDVHLPVSAKRTDEDIAQACLMALNANHQIPRGSIKPIVSSGWVTLEGKAGWYYQRTTAVDTVVHLTGVVGVTSQISVSGGVSPNDIQGKIKSAFHRSADIDSRRVNIETHDGKVILSGNVRSWSEREAAEHAAWAAPGVSEIENKITVTP